MLFLKERSDLRSAQKGVTWFPGSGKRFSAVKPDVMVVHFSRPLGLTPPPPAIAIFCQGKA